MRWLGTAAVAVATLGFNALVPATVSAQAVNSTQQIGHRVAVIDITHIFKNLPAIQAQVKKVELAVKAYETELKQKREALQQTVAKLKTLKQGSPEYSRLEEQVANMDSQLRLDVNRKRKEFADAEAKIYYSNYQQIASAVKAIATHNGIKLVLRFNSEKMDLARNESVARGVAKNVVFQDSSIDLTGTVMQYLEKQSNTPQVATGDRAASAAGVR